MSLKPFPFKWMLRTPSGMSTNITFCEEGPTGEKYRRALIECHYRDLKARNLRTMRRHNSFKGMNVRADKGRCPAMCKTGAVDRSEGSDYTRVRRVDDTENDFDLNDARK
jgi:hypothetical protein